MQQSCNRRLKQAKRETDRLVKNINKLAYRSEIGAKSVQKAQTAILKRIYKLTWISETETSQSRNVPTIQWISVSWHMPLTGFSPPWERGWIDTGQSWRSLQPCYRLKWRVLQKCFSQITSTSWINLFCSLRRKRPGYERTQVKSLLSCISFQVITSCPSLSLENTSALDLYPSCL